MVDFQTKGDEAQLRMLLNHDNVSDIEYSEDKSTNLSNAYKVKFTEKVDIQGAFGICARFIENIKTEVGNPNAEIIRNIDKYDPGPVVTIKLGK